MEAIKRVFIEIVTWNHARYLPDLFASLDKQTSEEWSVTVVDNASTDGTLAWLKEYRPECPVLRNFRNQGFARGHNQAISLALSRWRDAADLDRCYCFLVNPDTLLDPACIEEIVAFMDSHPNVVIAGPKLYRASRRAGEEGESVEVDCSHQFDSSGLVLRKDRTICERGSGEEDHGQYDGAPVFGVSGAAMVIRASAVPALSMGKDIPFDEEMFAYKEDVDLCWRARLFGLEISLIPKAVMWHYRYARASEHKGIKGLLAGQRSRSSFVNTYSRRNQLWVEWKNDDFSNRFVHLPWRLWKITLEFASMLIFRSHLKGVLEAWAGRGQIMEKRKEIQKRRVFSPEQMRHWFV
jgi:GT2 family glycosyltransferase